LTIKDGVLQVAVVQRDSDLACIDVKRNGEVREIKRDARHHWALSGGHIDFEKDDIDEAAARELLEETGIKVSVKSLIQIGAYGALGRDPVLFEWDSDFFPDDWQVSPFPNVEREQ
jgi:8-oxo-dGTP pyrophosphatase MutT (NUDIX family)